MIIKQILLVSTFENVWRTVWRIWILMLGFKGFLEYLKRSKIEQKIGEMHLTCNAILKTTSVKWTHSSDELKSERRLFLRNLDKFNLLKTHLR